MMWLSGHLPCDGAFLNQFLRFVVYRELWTSSRLLIFSALLIDEWGCGLPPLAANFLVFVGFFCRFFFVIEFCGFFLKLFFWFDVFVFWGFFFIIFCILWKKRILNFFWWWWLLSSFFLRCPWLRLRFEKRTFAAWRLAASENLLKKFLML